jgi:hypothetical protein
MQQQSSTCAPLVGSLGSRLALSVQSRISGATLPELLWPSSKTTMDSLKQPGPIRDLQFWPRQITGFH